MTSKRPDSTPSSAVSRQSTPRYVAFRLIGNGLNRSMRLQLFAQIVVRAVSSEDASGARDRGADVSHYFLVGESKAAISSEL
jgi:hypothetical protein